MTRVTRSLTLFIAILLIPEAALDASEYDFAAMIQKVPDTATFSDPDHYIWCGTVVCGDDAKCHLFYSRWPKVLLGLLWVVRERDA